MKSNDLIDIIGEAADEHIRDAKSATKKTMPRWAKWSSAIAACLVVAIGCISMLPRFSAPHDEAPSTGGGNGHGEGTVFMSYAGPVFPLTLMENNNAIDATRIVDYNFSTYLAEGDDIEVWGNNGGGVIIGDRYQLKNNSQNDATVTAVYPFVGDFQTMKWPVITLDGNEVEWKLDAGAYSGTFRGAGDETSTSLNLDNTTSWTEYRDLLTDGSYFSEAFTAPESLDQPVIVYKLSDLTDGAGDYDAASLCMSFKYDPEKTFIMTWGFNGGGIRDDTGDEFRDFFIREGRRKADEDVKYFIVVGDDLESYTIQGYLDGGCTPGEEIDDASATVTREEMTVGGMLREIAQIRYSAIIDNEFDGDHNRYLDNQISFEMYYQAVIKHFVAYGPLGADPMERYSFGRLEDIIDETAYHKRILYLSFEVTVPAGDSVEVCVEQFKNASFDFHCSGSESVGIDGYDLVTSLGSNLTFAGQSASISNYDAIEIVRQNFGFDLAGGITSVPLDLNEPHYYLEVREIDRAE